MHSQGMPGVSDAVVVQLPQQPGLRHLALVVCPRCPLQPLPYLHTAGCLVRIDPTAGAQETLQTCVLAAGGS